MFRFLSVLIFIFATIPTHAEEIHVAVASNFATPMKKIAAQFEQSSGHKIVMSFGSTGKFYGQIKNGAPFQVLLAADDEVPAQLEQEKFTVAGSRFTYAIGRLVLWSARPDFVDAHGEILKKPIHFTHLALANPKLAPYGHAAVETLKALHLYGILHLKLAQAANVAQTFHFISSGSVALGFVAMSQVYENGKLRSGSAWIVPTNLHAPIKQDAVILQNGRDKPAVAALMSYLKSDAAKRVIRSYGYEF